MTIPISARIGALVAIVDATALPDIQCADDVCGWLTDAQKELGAVLNYHGAILLRGFPINGSENFAAVATALGGALGDYVGGNSPRSAVSRGIYTSTEYPADYTITLHNELSYARSWPRRLFFYCERPATHGGETLLARSTVPLETLDAKVLEHYRSVGVSYLRNLHGGVGVGRSWQETFATDDRRTVTAHLTADGAEFTWKPNDGLWIRESRPAIRSHPDLRIEVWFNQVDQWHPSSLDESTRKALEMFGGELPLNATYGDGEPLDTNDLEAVKDASLKASVGIQWQSRDLLIVDNMLLAHGRASYRGDRRILVGMA